MKLVPLFSVFKLPRCTALCRLISTPFCGLAPWGCRLFSPWFPRRGKTRLRKTRENWGEKWEKWEKKDNINNFLFLLWFTYKKSRPPLFGTELPHSRRTPLCVWRNTGARVLQAKEERLAMLVYMQICIESEISIRKCVRNTATVTGGTTMLSTWMMNFLQTRDGLQKDRNSSSKNHSTTDLLQLNVKSWNCDMVHQNDHQSVNPVSTWQHHTRAPEPD